MNSVSKISRGQLLTLLFAGRLSGCLLFSSEQFANFSIWDCLISTFMNGAMLVLLFLPTLLFLRRGEEGVTEKAYCISNKTGKTVDGLYLLLCLFVLLLDIVQFSDFAVKTMREGFSVPVLTVVFLAVCLVASLYGVQAIARAATLVALFSALCLLVFCVVLLPEMRWFHFSPQETSGSWRAVQKAFIDLPRTAEVTAIGLLYPYVKGRRTGPCVAFGGLTALFSALVSITAVAVLGDFAFATAYPFYAAVTAAQIGVFQRLDVLIIAVWLGTFFVRFTLFCMLLIERSRNLFGDKAVLPTGVIAFVVLTSAALFIQSGSYKGEWQLATAVYWWALGGFCFVLPLILKWGGRRFERA